MTHYEWVARKQRANAAKVQPGTATGLSSSTVAHEIAKRAEPGCVANAMQTWAANANGSDLHRAGEVELVQRVLQRLDFVLQLGDEFVHVHLAKLGDVLDFVGWLA